jgi:tRNA(fMet)-specific endonuclease VapC
LAEARFLLDANCCILLIEQRSQPLRTAVERCSPGQVVTSAVAFAEVAIGIDWSDRAAADLVTDFFAVVAVLPFDREAGRAYADLLFKRHRFDRLIGAHALALGATLVTANPRDFRDVAGLRVEDWTT